MLISTGRFTIKLNKGQAELYRHYIGEDGQPHYDLLDWFEQPMKYVTRESLCDLQALLTIVLDIDWDSVWNG